MPEASEFLIKIGLPTDDSVYNPVFDAIGLILLGFNIICTIINFRKYRLFANYETEQLLQETVTSNKEIM